MFSQNKPLSIIRNITPILWKVHGNRIYPSKQGLDKILLALILLIKLIEQTPNRSRSPTRAKRGDEMPAGGEVSWIKIF